MTTPRPTPNRATSTRPERSSKRIAHRKPLGWLPWALLLALLALLALVFLAINAVDDDGPDGPAGDSLGQVSGSDGSGINGQDGAGAQASAPTTEQPAAAGAQPTQAVGAQPTQPAAAQPTQPGAGTAAGGSGAELKVGEDDLLGLTGGSLASRIGSPVSGSAQVESVVSNEGFWVGSSPAERTFVYLTPQARQANGESSFQVTAGQTVQLTGELAAPQSAPEAVAGVTAEEGLDQLTQQGAFVNAETVELED